MKAGHKGRVTERAIPLAIVRESEGGRHCLGDSSSLSVRLPHVSLAPHTRPFRISLRIEFTLSRGYRGSTW